MLEGFLEKIYPFLEEVIDENQIALQRKRFFSQVGDIYEDEDFYSERLNAFLEWLLIDADTPYIRRPIIKYILQNGGSLFDEETKVIAEAMIRSRRSIFLIAKKEKEFSVLEDIFDKDRFYVDVDPRIENTERKAIVESRVCVLKGRSRIMSTYLCFPDNIKKVLLKRLKLCKKDAGIDRDRFMEYAYTIFIRNERYKNIPIEKIAESLDHLISLKH
ncbi:MAG: hypothetical protein ACP5QK_05705 [Myxococcota bacterium]